MNCLGSHLPRRDYDQIAEESDASLSPSKTNVAGYGAAHTSAMRPPTSDKARRRGGRATHAHQGYYHHHHQNQRSDAANQQQQQHHHNHRDTVLCPTCRGQGSVPKEEEGHLVALIPADDARLRPSKTRSYVTIAVVCSLVVAVATIFFIYPRSFNLSSKRPDLPPIDLDINVTQQTVKFSVQNWWFLENYNYYPIQLTNLSFKAYMLRSRSQKFFFANFNATTVTIPVRGTSRVYASLPIIFQGDLAYLVRLCSDPRPWVHTVYFRFEATALANIMGYNFTSVLGTDQKAFCGREKTTTTTTTTTAAPTTTTTTTTTTTLKTTTTTTTTSS